MKNFQKSTNEYLNNALGALSNAFNNYETYEDFEKFNASRFLLTDHILFTLFNRTATGILDAIQFIGKDHPDYIIEVSSVVRRFHAKELMVGIDPIISDFISKNPNKIDLEDIGAIMETKMNFHKLISIPVHIREGNTRYQLIQKFIGFYAEDYIRMHIKDYKIGEITTWDDEYWDTIFHWIGFRSVFNKLFGLGIDVQLDDHDNKEIISRLVITERNNDRVPSKVVSVEIPINCKN